MVPYVLVPLTQGCYAMVDEEDFRKICQHNWFVTRSGCNLYASTWTGTDDRGKRIALRMHRAIMNPPAGYVVDHINGDGLDNRKCNLRLVTHTENCFNQRVASNNKSGYKGVSYHRRDEKWGAKITVRTQPVWLGYFQTAVEAAKAYNEAAIKHYGELARLNTIPA